MPGQSSQPVRGLPHRRHASDLRSLGTSGVARVARGGASDLVIVRSVGMESAGPQREVTGVGGE